MLNIKANPGKQLTIRVNDVSYERYPVKTNVIKIGDNLIEILKQYALPHLEPGDLIFMSEKIVAISQGRSYPIVEIKVNRVANFLSRRVYKSPYGIGLGSPWTMQLALNEVGYLRIGLGILAHLIFKPFGVKGMFYRVVGRTVAAIDGPCDYTLPPYNKYAKLGPKDPDQVAGQLKNAIGYDTVIIDANDLGVNILGVSSQDIPLSTLAAIFKDNPLGQTSEQTPIAIVRKKTDERVV